MKILKRVIVILIIILSMFYIKAFAATGKINIEATRLRKEKNTTSEILINIYKDEDVEIVEDFGEWLKVKYKEYTGFVKKQYVTIKEETKKENNSNSEDLVQENQNETKIKGKTFIRLIPNFMAKKIEHIEEEKKITIISEMNNWVQVTDGTITGWVLKSKIVNSSSVEDVKPQEEKKEENIQNKTDENKIKNEVTNTVKEDVKPNNKTNTQTNTQANTQMESVLKKGKINVETANVRKEPNTSAKRVDFLDEGDIVTITEETEEWYKIEYGDIKGYVSKQLITITSENGQVSSRGNSEERREESTAKNEVINQNEKNSNANEVVEYARKFLGYSYVLGGKTPETGFDCSGFTRYVYKNFGFNLSSVSYEQTNVGEEVTRENLKPGDLVLFYNEEKTKIGHTGIYIGNGEFIHAANPKRGVVCDNMNTLSYYNERFVTARRIVE